MSAPFSPPLTPSARAAPRARPPRPTAAKPAKTFAKHLGGARDQGPAEPGARGSRAAAPAPRLERAEPAKDASLRSKVLSASAANLAQDRPEVGHPDHRAGGMDPEPAFSAAPRKDFAHIGVGREYIARLHRTLAADTGPNPGRAPCSETLSAPETERLAQVRQDQDRAFGFSELGVLGQGRAVDSPGASPPITAAVEPAGVTPAAPCLARPLRAVIPADEAATRTFALASPAPAAAIAAAAEGFSARPADPATVQAEPTAARLLDGDGGLEETFGAAPKRGAIRDAQRAGAGPSVLLAKTDGELQVLVGSGKLTGAAETELRRRIAETLAESGERLGEVQINGRAQARRVPQQRQA